MLSITNSYTLNGLNGSCVRVEADIVRAMPRFDIVGLPDVAVRESRERVSSAIRNSGFSMPVGAITVNLAPAELKKEGAGLDLPIAVGLLRSSVEGLIRDLSKTIFLGELSLDGSVHSVQGTLPLLLSAVQDGIKTAVIPEANRLEAQYVSGVDVVCVKNLREVVDYLSGQPLDFVETVQFKSGEVVDFVNDLCFVKGQYVAKRALEVAVSGGHNILLLGSPGAGKTMLAKCIPSIMPDMSFEESLETTKIHSVAGTIPTDRGIVNKRPFITPHHTASGVSLIGGGNSLKPGLISLAHNGVLYLDEMPEYSRSVLESLRQPLEDRVITVSRAKGSVQYPASFTLCASMNPCPCGNYGSETKECTCSPSQIQKYKSKISGPLLDRIDIQVQVDGVNYDDLISENNAEKSKDVKKRVNTARKIQRERFKDDKILTNSEMREVHLKKYCPLSSECEKLMRKSYESLGLSARGRNRVIKVARTIADLDFSEEILPKHLLEAISYRSLDLNE